MLYAYIALTYHCYAYVYAYDGCLCRQRRVTEQLQHALAKYSNSNSSSSSKTAFLAIFVFCQFSNADAADQETQLQTTYGSSSITSARSQLLSNPPSPPPHLSLSLPLRRLRVITFHLNAKCCLLDQQHCARR